MYREHVRCAASVFSSPPCAHAPPPRARDSIIFGLVLPRRLLVRIARRAAGRGLRMKRQSAETQRRAAARSCRARPLRQFILLLDYTPFLMPAPRSATCDRRTELIRVPALCPPRLTVPRRSHRKFRVPRHGNLGFKPRKRTRHVQGKFKAFPKDQLVRCAAFCPARMKDDDTKNVSRQLSEWGACSPVSADTSWLSDLSSPRRSFHTHADRSLARRASPST